MKKTAMKAMIVTVLMLCLLALGILAISAETEGYYTYSVTNGEATITKVDRQISGDIEIPAKLGGYPVTGIGDDAFFLCESLTSITIPDSVTSIGDYAFQSCSSLTSIIIPESVTSIGDLAFAECLQLRSVAIPESVTTLGEGMFVMCQDIENITVSEGNDAYHCDGDFLIETKSKTLIWAIKWRSNYVIPNDGSVTSIGDYAFWGKGGNLNIPTSIGSVAFAMSSFTNITIPEGVTSIGSGTFDIMDLTSITFLSPTTEIYDNKYTISGTATIYGYTGSTAQAYAEKYNRTFVALDEEEEEQGTEGLIYTLNDAGTEYSVTGYEGTATEVLIPSTHEGKPVTGIGEKAFYMCTTVTSITIPERVTSIGNYAFSNCSKLTSITFLSPTTEIYDASYTISSTATIYGYIGSTAQAYAEKYNRTFVALDEEVEPATLTISSATVRVGSQVTLTVTLENNPGLAYLSVTPVYDTSALTLVSVVNGGIISDFDQGTNLIWSTATNATANGTMMTFTFHVHPDAPVGDYEIDLTLRECYNELDEDVAVEVVSGTLTVVDFIYGDVNGDRVINGRDILALRRYLANFDYTTNTSTVTVALGADANGDGTVNGQDLLLLRKYMAYYNYDTGISSIVLGPQSTGGSRDDGAVILPEEEFW